MSWFKKEEKIHYIRDDEGKVQYVTREGDRERTSRTPVSDELMKQAPRKQSAWERFKEGQHERNKWKQEVRQKEKQAYRESFTKGKIRKARIQGYKAGSTDIGDRINNFVGGANPPRIQRSSYMLDHTIKGNYNPFGSTFDRGMPKLKKPKINTKYAVVHGKAYPIGNFKPKKPHKKKKQRRSGMNFDMMDNWGFMK